MLYKCHVYSYYYSIRSFLNKINETIKLTVENIKYLTYMHMVGVFVISL